MKGKTYNWLGFWLASGVLMLMIQIILGGVTRLTGSGLSITEWKPLLGILPPLDKESWEYSFKQYQQIAQFKKLNSNFSLSDYQYIFFWEWLHREWARLMALVFVIPFFIFLLKGMFPARMTKRLVVLFILGGLQGGIGWIMVQSGLNDTDVRVSHIRLALHFIFALVLLSFLFWLCLERFFSQKQTHPRKITGMLLPVLLILLTLQLVYGAFMAGTHAALSAATWPDINGTIIPDHLLMKGTIEYNLVYNPLMIQFIHRSLAYVITILTLIWCIRGQTHAGRFRWVPLALVVLQCCLGVLALINSFLPSAIWLSVFHQLIGIVLLMSLIACLYADFKLGKAE